MAKKGKSNSRFVYRFDGSVIFWCPGCKMPHAMLPGHVKTGPDNAPTFSPSLVSRIDAKRVCHLYILGGKIDFLSDCWHSLARKCGVDVPALDGEEVPC
jgi:hypothetical protein